MALLWTVIATVLIWCPFVEGSVLSFGHMAVDGDINIANEIRSGIESALNEYNQNNGQSCGHSLTLLPMGNFTIGGSTNITQVAEQMILTNNITGFIGSYGPSSTAASALFAQTYGVSNVAPMNGSQLLRTTSMNNTFNLRISQADQGLAIVQYLRVNRSFELISLFYERSFIESNIIASIMKACTSTGYDLLTSIGCPSASVADVNRSMSLVISSSLPHFPDAIIVIASSSVTSSFISMARNTKNGNSIIFGVISDADPSTLQQNVGNDVSNIVFTQVFAYSLNDY